MSGFAGMISLDGAPPDVPLLERMAQTLAFRGPDGTHITTKPGAGFCFTSLRTGPAPQCPAQPCSLDGRVWLLGDIRLDGRDDLRHKLEQHGEEIATDATDEELVLRAWRRWQEDCLADLIGDYSFALWDAEVHHLWCVRDLMGARPFFYAQAGDHLYFSNTLNTIRCATHISTALDERFIGDFLLQGWCSYPARTAFRNVSRLSAGHRLHFSSDGLEVRRYTSLPIEEPLGFKREEEYVECFRNLLDKAVRERLPAGRVAIFMSGGLDSTSVAAIAVHTARKSGLPLDLLAFTSDYQPLFDDQEGALASVAAQHIGINIEIQRSASYSPYGGWDVSPPPMPEPLHEPFQCQSFDQAQRVARHSRVALNGHGGDGVLTGQAWPYFLDLARRRRFGMIARTFGGYVLKHKSIPPLRGGFRAKLRGLVQPSDPMAGYPSWLSSNFEIRMRLRDRWRELLEPPARLHAWHSKAYATLSSPLWPSLLETEDAAGIGVCIEARAPFLDLRIQRFLLRVPPIPLCIDKEIIRRMTVGLLPEKVRLRPKTPFEGDLIALTKTRGWRPLRIPELSGRFCEFVDREALSEVLETEPISFPWPSLRPISLAYWLHTIENQPPIQ